MESHPVFDGTPRVALRATPARLDDERFRRLVETLELGIWTVDAFGVTDFVNPSALALLGCAAEMMLDRHISAVDFPMAVAPVLDALARCTTHSRETGEIRVPLRGYRGPQRTVRFTVLPVSDANAQFCGAMATLLDVTDAERDVGRASEIERNWRELYDDTPWGHLLLDGAGVITEINNTAAAVFGYARDEILGSKRLADIVAPAHVDRFTARVERLRSERWPRDDEYVLLKKDGVGVTVLMWGALIRDEEGGSGRTRVSVFDISKRKLAQDELQESELRNTAILRAALDCVISIDSAGKVIEFNPAAERTFGYTREQVLGEDVSTLIIPPAMRDAHRAGIVRYLKTGRPVLANRRVQVTAMRSDGGEFPAELAITAVELQNETIFTAYLRDVSREKWAEQELRRYADERRAISHRLVAVQEAERGTLAAGLHDLVGQKLTALNINLNIVKSHLPVDHDPMSNSRLDESLALVEETIESIRDVMGSLRPAVLDDYGLAAGLRWYAELFTKRTGVATAIEQDGPVGRLPVSVEEALFRIAQEALANVAKYAQAQSATLTLRAIGEGILLTVGDDGRGFDAGSPHQPTRDSGWGLMIMRERAAAVGARLSVESAPGAGTKVSVEWMRAE